MTDGSLFRIYYKKSPPDDNGWQDPADDLDNTEDHGSFDLRGSLDDLSDDLRSSSSRKEPKGLKLHAIARPGLRWPLRSTMFACLHQR